MSNPSIESNTTRRPESATASREEWLAYLATDPDRGLSGREADRRRDRSAARPLFTTTARRFATCLVAALREPVLWILLSVSLIALFFDRTALGLASLALTAGHTLLCAYLLYRAERVDGSMQRAYDAPLARVLRAGRVCRVGAEAVVPGDILLIYEGDLVPADCRLLRTEHFAVSERELDATDPGRPRCRLEKDAEFVASDPVSPRLSPSHMVYAGAVAESGFAVAVAIAVGSDTHIGRLMGGIRPAHGGRRPAVIKATAKIASMTSVTLAILLIPLVVVGIFTLGDRYEFFDIFLSALALATLALCEHTVAKFAYLSAAIRREAATARDSINTADIRTAADVERLSEMTDILLLDTSALHDGIAHPVELRTAGKRYRCDMPEADDDAAAAVELLFLWQYGRAPVSATSDRRTDAALRTLIPSLCEWAGTDTDALLVKYKDIFPEGGSVSATVSTAAGNERMTVTVTGETDAEGLSCLDVLCSRASEKESLCAVLIYAPHTCPKTAGWIKNMESAGIRVSALLTEGSPAHIRTLSAVGLCERHPACRPNPDRVLADRIDGGVRAFVGCTDSEIETCIRDLQSRGRTVGVLSVDGRDISHLNAADVALTCSPSLFVHAESDFIRPVEGETRTVADGLPMSDCATDLGRRRADVVVRRATSAGGGLGGVRMALLTADRTSEATAAASAYLFLANALRLLTVILSLIFGLCPIPVPVLMLSGWGLDTLVLFFLSRLSLNTAISPRRTPNATLDRPWYTHRVRLICLSLTATLPWAVAFVARLLAADIGGGMAGYALICLAVQQIAVYLSLRPRRRDRGSASASLILTLVYVGALAASLAMGLHPLYAILVPPIPAMLYIVAASLTKRLQQNRRA